MTTPEGALSDPGDLPLEELDEDALRDRTTKLTQEIAVWRARLSLLLSAAVQYELDRIGGEGGIEIIASVAGIPPSQLWTLLSGDYRPTPQTWTRIEKVLMLCHASRSVERLTAARELFLRIIELSAEKDRVVNLRIERNRRRRGLDLGIGSAGRLPQSDSPGSTGPQAIVESKDNPPVAKAEDASEPAERPFAPPAIPDLKGHDQRPDPLRATTQAKFVATMRAYRAWAGNPSFRDMESRCAKQISYSTFRNMLNATTIPKKLSAIETFVRVLGGTAEDQQRWATAWRRLAMNEFNRADRRDPPHNEAMSEDTTLHLLPRPRAS